MSEGNISRLVSIVGAGPGDPELLTVKALRKIQEADVLVYDRLVGVDILKRGRKEAKKIFVGKTKGRHSCGQNEINATLLQEAKPGRNVVRLKGGDPFNDWVFKWTYRRHGTRRRNCSDHDQRGFRQTAARAA